jgi:hypothetical protein
MPKQRDLNPPCLPFHHAPIFFRPVELDEPRTDIESAKVRCVAPAFGSPKNADSKLGRSANAQMPPVRFTYFYSLHKCLSRDSNSHSEEPRFECGVYTVPPDRLKDGVTGFEPARLSAWKAAALPNGPHSEGRGSRARVEVSTARAYDDSGTRRARKAMSRNLGTISCCHLNLCKRTYNTLPIWQGLKRKRRDSNTRAPKGSRLAGEHD